MQRTSEPLAAPNASAIAWVPSVEPLSATRMLMVPW
jgi:hypothetical protein